MIYLDRLEQVKILVAGDYMLDRYCYGTIDRLSPEAPVPVLNVRGERNVPGGAANVVNNLCKIGCKVISFGIIGDDEAGETLTGMLYDAGAGTKYLRPAQSYRTIIKTRIVGNDKHQIARLDYNEDIPFPGANHLSDSLADALSGCNIAILSDYGKGFCGEDTAKTFIDICRGLDIPVIVDPKGANWGKYRGAAWITPNFGEFAAVTHKPIRNTDDDINANIAEISDKYGIENVLVTRSEQGMTFFNGKAVSHIRAKAKDVFDVSGAGDTVVSALGAMLGAGCEKLTSVETANLAAGIVITKSGTAAVTRTELESELRHNRLDRISAKIMDWNTLFAQVARWKSDGKTVAVANGCFDIFHKGHASLINAASRCADKLIMAINADETVRRLKGDGRPINGELDRAYVLAALESVAAVVIFEQDTPEELLSHILPDVLVKGGEYTIEQVPGRQYAKRVELADYIDGYSTTTIVSKSKEG